MTFEYPQKWKLQSDILWKQYKKIERELSDDKRLKANILMIYQSKIGLKLDFYDKAVFESEKAWVKPSDTDDRKAVIIIPGFLKSFF